MPAPGPSLWRAPEPLLLASASPIRRAMLEAAGLPVEVEPARIDERALAPDGDAKMVAAALARAKALEVSSRRQGRLVLGCDQTLDLDGLALHKPAGRADAARQLAAMAGRAHDLTSAFALARGGAVLAEGALTARLTMRGLAPETIDAYLDAAGPAALASVGCYQIEGLGSHLMERIEGDHFTIMGLPLLPVLAALRGLGLLGPDAPEPSP